MRTPFLLVLTFLSLFSVAADVKEKSLPPESIVLSLPQGVYGKWKEISRSVTEEYGLVERIPDEQTISDWTQLICIQYFSRSKLSIGVSAADIAESLRETVRASYPGKKVTFRIIEKNNYAFTYEWILHEPYKGVPLQHYIGRCALTKKGSHSVGFTQHGTISKEERKKWIDLLKKSTRIVPFEKAFTSHTKLSLADQCRDSVVLSPFFKKWHVVSDFVNERGFTSICRVSPEQKEFVRESLEIVTMPNFNGHPLETFFDSEKACIQQKSSDPVELKVLKRSPTEVIYCYEQLKEACRIDAEGLVIDLYVNSVVRSFLKDDGYYSMAYNAGRRFEQDTIARCVEKLEAIQVNRDQPEHGFKPIGQKK